MLGYQDDPSAPLLLHSPFSLPIQPVDNYLADYPIKFSINKHATTCITVKISVYVHYICALFIKRVKFYPRVFKFVCVVCGIVHKTIYAS